MTGTELLIAGGLGMQAYNSYQSRKDIKSAASERNRAMAKQEKERKLSEQQLAAVDSAERLREEKYGRQKSMAPKGRRGTVINDMALYRATRGTVAMKQKIGSS